MYIILLFLAVCSITCIERTIMTEPKNKKTTLPTRLVPKPAPKPKPAPMKKVIQRTSGRGR